MDPNQSEEEFTTYVKTLSAGGLTSSEYKRLYEFLLNCFVEADRDLDGKINLKEFDEMIEVAAAAPRKFGYAPTWQSMYTNEAGRITGRKAMFTLMDTNHDGTISFDEWLSYAHHHIVEKAKGLK